MRNTIEEYGAERLEPGDVIVANDPYRTARTSTTSSSPGRCSPAGSSSRFVNLKAHQLDMGGVVPGGFTLAKSNIYENGLVLSPRALFKGGKPVHETWSLIFDNVRFGEILFPDMRVDLRRARPRRAAARGDGRALRRRAVHGAMRYACDASAERMPFALEAIPDGEWEGEDLVDCDALDDAEEYLVRVKITKRGGRAEVDFSGTLAAGAHVHQLHAARREDDRRGRLQVPVRPARLRSRRGRCAASTWSSRRARW